MGNRGRLQKVTTVTRDLFGNKRVETEWVEKGGGCITLIALAIVVVVLVRGCGS